jgi:hypothetical protein
MAFLPCRSCSGHFQAHVGTFSTSVAAIGQMRRARAPAQRDRHFQLKTFHNQCSLFRLPRASRHAGAGSAVRDSVQRRCPPSPRRAGWHTHASMLSKHPVTHKYGSQSGRFAGVPLEEVLSIAWRGACLACVLRDGSCAARAVDLFKAVSVPEVRRGRMQRKARGLDTASMLCVHCTRA